MKRTRTKTLPGLPFRIIVPNMVTVGALCAGLTAIRLAQMNKWEAAVGAILIAALFDGLDGRIARLLKGQSQFGVELDSLSDMVSFGVAPSLLLYHWVMYQLGPLGWGICLAYTVCVALRLARFNTRIGAPDLPKFAKSFFIGVPSPAAAFLALMPMMLSFDISHHRLQDPTTVGIIMAAVSLLMVSRVPTFAFKHVRLPYVAVVPLLVGVVVLAANALTNPWAALGALGGIYLITLPVGAVYYLWRLRTQGN